MQTLAKPTLNKHSPRFEQPLKVVALGDSLVYGFGDPIGGGWVERLRRSWMEADDHILYNLGIRGDRVAQLVVLRHDVIEWIPVESLTGDDRGGGFGHSGR